MNPDQVSAVYQLSAYNGVILQCVCWRRYYYIDGRMILDDGYYTIKDPAESIHPLCIPLHPLRVVGNMKKNIFQMFDMCIICMCM